MAFGSGFHGQEDWSGTSTHWMKANATLLINSSKNRTATLSLNAQSFYRNRTLEIYAGDDLLAHSIVSPSRFVDVATQVHLSKGVNFIRFHVPEGCERPNDKPKLNNSDSRCLSVAVQNISLSDILSVP